MKKLIVEVHDSSELVTVKLSSAVGRIMLALGFFCGLWAPHDSAWWLSLVAVAFVAWIGLLMVLNPFEYAPPSTEPLPSTTGDSQSSRNSNPRGQ